MMCSLVYKSPPPNKDKEIEKIISGMGIKIVNYSGIISRYYSLIDKANIPANSHKLYFMIEAPTKDPYAAALYAVGLLNNKSSILVFYNLIKPLRIDTTDCFVICCPTSYVKKIKIVDLFSANLFLENSNKVFANTLALFSNDSSYSELKNKLSSVFAYNNISAQSLFQEEKYINLWIALESIMRTGQYTNIISHIKEVLPSIMCKKYIYRIVRNFSEDCIRCDINFNSSPLNIDLKNEDKQTVVRSVINAFKNITTSAEIDRLCSNNFLLQHRQREIKELISSNENILIKLQRYHETITWHLQRLYRIRNKITHSAFQQNGSIIIYIEHLFDFLAIVISEVVYLATEKEMTSIENIMPFLKDSYDIFIDLLKANDPSCYSSTESGIIEIFSV